jgi:2-hydroxy-3-oxopropionate reductase
VFERVQPLLKAMGKHITHVGGIGAGQVAKIANQIVVGINLAAVAEALVFAANAGADVGKVRDALMGGFAASRVLDLHGRRMISRSFEPGFRIALHHKDLRLAADSAAALGLNLPNLECTRQLMERCEADGWAGLDHAAVIKGIEAGAITPGP